ncbi:MAG: SPOR domain-containing protein [Spirochaetaceae bacterium]|nr:SPOR domain-containing protein [Spirochaetaceae bacterium]
MDKKKLLLVAASVGMFLVIVMGAAILVFTPRSKTAFSPETPPRTAGALEPQTGTFGIPAAPDAAGPVPPGWIQRPAVPPPAYPEGGYGQQAAGQPALPPPEFPPAAPAEYGQARDSQGRTHISIAAPVNAGVPDAHAYPETPHGQKLVAAARPPSHEAPPQNKPAVRKAAAKTQSKGGYWVQTGSYAKKSHADGAKDFLLTKGINSIVLNTSVGGKTYYRVRVGPYISQNEADYWLSLIRAIDGMEQSQVWKSGS